MTCGVPWPRGALSRGRRLEWVGGGSPPPALQVRVLDRWPDGSARWTLLDWRADCREGSVEYAVGVGSGRTPDAKPWARPAQRERGVLVDTGTARFLVGWGRCFPFDRVTIDGRSALDVRRSGLLAIDAAGTVYEPQSVAARIAETGPVRTAVDLTAVLTAERGAPLADLRCRLHFFRGMSVVRVELSVTNPRRARHPGNLWELGDRGSILLRDLGLRFALPETGQAHMRCSPERGAGFGEVEEPFEIYQDSSGGENWRSSCHVNREERVPTRFRGYRRRSGRHETSGLRATPVVILQAGDRVLGVTQRLFWQEFPKAIEAAAGVVTLRLFPRQFDDLHELQGGERKTHGFHVSFDRDGVTSQPLDWCRTPLLAHSDPAWYAGSGAVPHLLPRAEDPHGAYLELVDLALEGDDTFVDKREAVDEYGWRHFGDLWADHEAVGGRERIISHYNNQYDVVGGCALQFLRSADPRWHALMDDMAAHVVDIDLYHTSEDKSAYNHGQFWHTVHHIDAGRSTHRSYPAAQGVDGGGPSGGHLYTTGLLLHHFLTGSERSREAVASLGRYVLDADDGARSVLRFLDRSPTGHVTLSGYDGFHGAGRSAANSLNALLDAHRLTGEEPFLAKAEEIVARCVHPGDDLAKLDLLDVENRWFYTMFLQSLGKYLEHRVELGRVDRHYDYARAALLHYALWAAEHERPYLDRTEQLEFPTETWAAQDLRKSEVFWLAARHAAGADRRSLQERARYFFRYSTEALSSMPTRSLSRPVVIVLGCGYREAYFERHADDVMPAPSGRGGLDFGAPSVFRPQKERAKRKLLCFAGIALLAALAGRLAARGTR